MFIDYILDEKYERVVNKLPFNPLVNPEQMEFLQKKMVASSFRTLEEQIGAT